MRRLLVIIVAVLGWNILVAKDLYLSTNIGLREGLSNNFVVDMALDKQGFLWVTTESGLNRICGNTHIVYKKETSGITSNEVTSLYADTINDKIWIATMQDGLCVYDGQTHRFHPFSIAEGLVSDAVSCVTKAADDHIWILHWNGQIQSFDNKSGQLSLMDFGVTFKSQVCLDDGSGHLYIGHLYDGLSIVDVKTNEVRRYTCTPNDQSTLPANYVRSVFIDHDKNVWIGTSKGLALLDPQTGKCHRFMHSATDPSSIGSDNIYSITEISGGRLCVVSDQGGVSLLDLDRFSAANPEQARFDNTLLNQQLSSMNSRKLIEDHYGNIWVGQYQTGVDVVCRDRRLFQTVPNTDNVYGMLLDREGRLWLGGAGELSVPGIVQCVEEDRAGDIWLGKRDEGVVKYDPYRKEFAQIDLGAPSVDIYDLYCDSNDKMWICSGMGLFSYNKGQIDKEEQIAKLIGHPVVMAIAKDSNSMLWIGTLSHGLFCIAPGADRMTRYTMSNGMPSNHINDIFIASDETVWAATMYGLACISENGLQIYNQRQGLEDNHVRAIQEDRSGNIWVSTYSNVACLDRSINLFHNYSYKDGLPVGNYIEKSVVMEKDGTILFGNTNGICRFSPQSITVSSKRIPVKIISCEALKSQTEKGDTEVLSPDAKGTFHLNYPTSTVRLLFATPDFSEKDNADYSYMIKGAEGIWYDTDGDDRVTFRNLSPGRYTFKLRCKQSNQTWANAASDEITIAVHPPFWLTRWAKLLYLLFLAGVVYTYFVSYKRRLELRNSLFVSQREHLQKEELNEERLRFFTNVAHELRTPLTLILGPLEDLKDDGKMPEAYRKKVASIYSNADRLQSLIDDILEFRKTETHNRKLMVAKGDLGALVNEIGRNFIALSRNPKVAISVYVDPDLPKVYYDSEIVTTIANNLMTNAIKYTPSGKISLTLNKNGDYLDLHVVDTGYGIAPEALPHIFDRYYQAMGKHQASGTGIGLALVKALADLHEGRLSVSSRLGKGSDFVFGIKIGNYYPEALHKEDEPDVSPAGTSAFDEGKRQDDDVEKDVRPLLLIVEDNDDIRQYVKDSLREDYRIVEGCDGQEGLSAAFSRIPDIIVSDIMMPQMDGVEMTRRLKEDVRTSHIPIILLTAKNTLDDKEEGYNSGADSYLTKPFSAKLLRSRIQNLLSSRRRLAELILFRQQEALEQAESDEKATPEKKSGMSALSNLDCQFLDHLNKLIEENISNEELDMNEMAGKLAMSYSTFYRKVKTLIGMSPNDYIRKKRLHRSMELLKSGSYTVKEAAVMTGFNNPGNFREQFKREFGKAPSSFAPQGNKS